MFRHFHCVILKCLPVCVGLRAAASPCLFHIENVQFDWAKSLWNETVEIILSYSRHLKPHTQTHIQLNCVYSNIVGGIYCRSQYDQKKATTTTFRLLPFRRFFFTLSYCKVHFCYRQTIWKYWKSPTRIPLSTMTATTTIRPLFSNPHKFLRITNRKVWNRFSLSGFIWIFIFSISKIKLINLKCGGSHTSFFFFFSFFCYETVNGAIVGSSI